MRAIIFTIKIYKANSKFGGQKLIIKLELMECSDRTEYLSRIDEIRLRIQTKQAAQNRDSRPRPQEPPNGQNAATAPRVDPVTLAEDLTKRRPLESAEAKANQFNERVRELDSVSEKIKALLSHKRTPKTSAPAPTTPTTFLENIPNLTPLTGQPTQRNEKLTSLFQKDLLFSESKVGEGFFGDLRSRDLASNFKEKLNDAALEAPTSTTTLTLPQTSQYTIPLEPKLETKAAQDSSPAFDIDTFKKRFMKEISKDANVKPNEPYPIYNTPAPARERAEPPASKREPPASRQVYVSKATRLASCPETSKLLEVLVRQIELQARLRTHKQKFDAFRADNKMSLLREELGRRRVSLSERELQEWVCIEEEEFDPFVSVVFTREFNFAELIEAVLQARSHWEQRVRRCVQGEELQREEPGISGLARRGSIQLEDLVCWVNLQNDSSLRNRDLFSLFKHLMLQEAPQLPPEHRITLHTLLAFVSR